MPKTNSGVAGRPYIPRFRVIFSYATVRHLDHTGKWVSDGIGAVGMLTLGTIAEEIAQNVGESIARRGGTALVQAQRASKTNYRDFMAFTPDSPTGVPMDENDRLSPTNETWHAQAAS